MVEVVASIEYHQRSKYSEILSWAVWQRGSVPRAFRKLLELWTRASELWGSGAAHASDGGIWRGGIVIHDFSIFTVEADREKNKAKLENNNPGLQSVRKISRYPDTGGRRLTFLLSKSNEYCRTGYMSLKTAPKQNMAKHREPPLREIYQRPRLSKEKENIKS